MSGKYRFERPFMSQNHLSRDEDTMNTWPPVPSFPRGAGAHGIHYCEKSAGRWTPGAKASLRSALCIGL